MNHPLVQGLLLAAIVGAATFAANRASSDDVVRAVKAHGQQQHAATVDALREQTATNARQAAKLAKLEDVPTDIRGIRARIDTMLMGDHHRSPRRERMRKAAAKIRSDARKRGEDDPLAGLEDL